MRRAIILVIAALVAGFFAWPEPQSPDLEGLWARSADELPERSVRFYYFHPGGKGLYRYGRRTLNTTESFDWEVDGDRLALRFRKTGETHVAKFSLADGWLTLHDDPREPTSTRYERKRGPMGGGEDLGRMWTQVEKYVTGGFAFRIYQLHEVDASGRGIGWFHRGDFDNWSTESLDYRVEDGKITLDFEETSQTHTTTMIRGTNKGRKSITLVSDPRDYWHRRTYEDAGRSFEVIRMVAPDALWSGR